ncbi:MAG: hypothetical protein PHQ43_08715 [Dehalococcoidales bacterium]|nr:hypothetical protein [Dehalococcoidales bacterium]
MNHAEKCPVCGGNGFVPAGFYSQAIGGDCTSYHTGFETCRSCDGRGYVVIADGTAQTILRETTCTIEYTCPACWGVGCSLCNYAGVIRSAYVPGQCAEVGG